MEFLIRDLIEKLYERQKKELDFIEQYKETDVKGPILISSGKIIEIDNLIKNLEEMLQYQSRMRNI